MVAQIHNSIQSFAQQLQSSLPDASVDFTAYPSGSAMLDVRRRGRLFVMEYSPSRGYGVDEVLDGEGFQVGYRFHYQELARAGQKLIELASQTTPQLNLVVIYVDDLIKSKEFYESLGLTFTKEKHNSGPEHFSCRLGQEVFEIYPCRKPRVEPPATRIGFFIASVDRVVSLLSHKGVTVKQPPSDSPWGRRAVVVDPDGHIVELTSNGAALVSE